VELRGFEPCAFVQHMRRSSHGEQTRLGRCIVAIVLKIPIRLGRKAGNSKE
jgi:hypothetical protein